MNIELYMMASDMRGERDGLYTPFLTNARLTKQSRAHYANWLAPLLRQTMPDEWETCQHALKAYYTHDLEDAIVQGQSVPARGAHEASDKLATSNPSSPLLHQPELACFGDFVDMLSIAEWEEARLQETARKNAVGGISDTGPAATGGNAERLKETFDIQDGSYEAFTRVAEFCTHFDGLVASTIAQALIENHFARQKATAAQAPLIAKQCEKALAPVLEDQAEARADILAFLGRTPEDGSAHEAEEMLRDMQARIRATAKSMGLKGQSKLR